MPLRIPSSCYIEITNPYEISYQNKHEVVSVSSPDKEASKELFTFTLIEVGLKEAP